MATWAAGHLFKCPNCGETINSATDACKYCNAPVDHAAAEKAAERLGLINDAISTADTVKYAAIALPIAFGISMVPMLGMAGTIAFIVLLVVVPVLVIRWWVKHDKVTDSKDADYAKAKKTVVIAAVVWAGTLVLWLVVGVLMAVGGMGAGG